jgi:hypothetical protein
VDILEFLAHSEWPIVVGGALWLFHKPLRKMAERVNLTRIDAWGIKAEFEKGLDKIEVLTPPRNEEKKPTVTIDVSKIIEGTSKADPLITPEMIVLGTWRAIEERMRPFAVGTSMDMPMHYIRLKSAARRLGLRQDEIDSLILMRRLRNKVARTPDAQLSWEDAERFKDAAVRLLARLETLRPDEEGK